MKDVVLVANLWREDSREIGEAHEKELAGRFFKQALDRGAQMVLHRNSTESTKEIVRRILVNHPVVLKTQMGPADDQRDTTSTTTGEDTDREPGEQSGRRVEEPRRVQGEPERSPESKGMSARPPRD